MFEDLESRLPELAELYKDLHAHPELSFSEHRTAGVLADRLDAVGCEVTTGVGGTGVVATLDGGDPDGPTVLLRADMDALPVKEETGLPYASEVTAVDPQSEGSVAVAHACGHDMHVTWLVGAAQQLAAHRDRWRGRVLLVGQPAEEWGAGATRMVADGLFERFGTPDVGLGQHVAPAPAGWVLHRPGLAMAGSDAVRIVLHGRGGHGSTPEKTVDPAVLAASTVMKLQTVVSREVAATDMAVVTVGSLHVGTKENVISDRAELSLSVRSLKPRVRQQLLDAIERIVHAECSGAGAPEPPEIETLYSFPPLVNDEEATERLAARMREQFGQDRTGEVPLVPASEDFGQFGTLGGFPSVFWFVGGTDPDTWLEAAGAGRLDTDIPSNHSSRFAPVIEPTLTTGIEAMVSAAMIWCGKD